jgi:hypothetical protein
MYELFTLFMPLFGCGPRQVIESKSSRAWFYLERYYMVRTVDWPLALAS